MHTSSLLRLLCLALLPHVAYAAPQGFIAEAVTGLAEDSARRPVSVNEPAIADKEEKQIHAFHVDGTPPHIDGWLDDQVWTLAQSIDDFVQLYPDNMAPATERTTVKVAYDDRFLYVAVYCFSRDPLMIRGGLGRRDQFPESDRVYIYLDPRHDHQTAYVFQINPSGVLGDFTFFDDDRASSDYDGVWDGRAEIVADGWTAEFRIPFSQLRFTAASDVVAVWGFNVGRDIAKTGESDRWVSTPRGAQGFVSRFGHLIFDERFAPPRRVELLPFILGGAFRDSFATPIRRVASLNGGLDIRLGLGTSTTLSATINPDFGQVEADPAVLNLSVFETFFPEKRPFFLEDSRIFVLPFDQAPDFYSRRIGNAPGHFSLSTNETLVRKPDRTTILGAAKLSGKTSGWTYGGLAVLTGREYAVVDRTIADEDGSLETVRVKDRLIDPRTLYSVGRVQRDVMHSTSNVGFIVTSVTRERDLDAFTGGPDYNLRWNNNHFMLNGHMIGTSAPIDRKKESAFGQLQNFNFNSKHLSLSAHYDHFDKKFRNSDIGFLSSRTNKSELTAAASLMRPDPGKHFREMSWSNSYQRGWNANRLVFSNSWTTDFYLRFLNYWSMDAGRWHAPHRLDDLDTRGGPPIVKPAASTLYLNISSDSRKTWNLFLHAHSSADSARGWERGFSPSLRLQPSHRVQASIGVDYISADDSAQWIRNDDLDGDGMPEYIYGRLRRQVVNVIARSTFAFSPTMTLEAFLQPFVAVGRYTNIAKLARPYSFEFTPIPLPDNPDFNVKSLRGAVVMRWEYVRGSTLYAVWNISNYDGSEPGVFHPWHDLGSGFRARGTSAFVMKLLYWFTP